MDYYVAIKSEKCRRVSTI